MHLGRVLCALLCLLAVLSGGEATLSKKDKKGKKKKEQVDPISTLVATPTVHILQGYHQSGIHVTVKQVVVTYTLLVEAFAIGT